MPLRNRCPGKIYSYRENHFVNKDGEIIIKKSFYPLKRKSCKGCDECAWQDEWPYEIEDIEYLSSDNYSTQKLYHLDWVDDECIEMVEWRGKRKQMTSKENSEG